MVARLASPWHLAARYPTLCNLAGADPTDDPPVPPLPIDPADPTKDIYGNTSWPPLDGVDVWPLLTADVPTNATAAHPDGLWLSREVRLAPAAPQPCARAILCVGKHAHMDIERRHPFLPPSGASPPHYPRQVMLLGPHKIVVAQPDPSMMSAKSLHNGWKWPNGTWVDSDDATYGCNKYQDRTNFRPCLFDVVRPQPALPALPSRRNTPALPVSWTGVRSAGGEQPSHNGPSAAALHVDPAQ